MKRARTCRRGRGAELRELRLLQRQLGIALAPPEHEIRQAVLNASPETAPCGRHRGRLVARIGGGHICAISAASVAATLSARARFVAEMAPRSSGSAATARPMVLPGAAEAQDVGPWGGYGLRLRRLGRRHPCNAPESGACTGMTASTDDSTRAVDGDHVDSARTGEAWRQKRGSRPVDVGPRCVLEACARDAAAFTGASGFSRNPSGDVGLEALNRISRSCRTPPCRP